MRPRERTSKLSNYLMNLGGTQTWKSRTKRRSYSANKSFTSEVQLTSFTHHLYGGASYIAKILIVYAGIKVDYFISHSMLLR